MSNNRNIPAIPAPASDPQALMTVLGALKAGVESLGGMRGKPLDRAATLQDLVDLQLVTAAQVSASSSGTPIATAKIPYHIPIFVKGAVSDVAAGNANLIYRLAVPLDIVLPKLLTGSKAIVRTPAGAGAVSFNLNQIVNPAVPAVPTTIGTLDFAMGAYVGVFTVAAQTVLSTGQAFDLVCTLTDATFAHMSVTLAGLRF